MRTQVMHERARDLPWLEQCPDEGGLPQRTALDSFPFSIGRDEDLCLPIASKRVSRHHATILQTEEGYLIRDLESTNGTFLNGSQIREALLSDGDLLVFADVEFTFFTGQSQECRNTATLVIERSRPTPSEPWAWEIVRSVRRLEEMLVSDALDLRLSPVVHLADQELFGVVAEGGWEIAASELHRAEQAVYTTDCRLMARLRQLRRRQAAEAARQLPETAALFVTVEDAELGDPRLGQSLVRLQHSLGGQRRLVTLLPPAVFEGASPVQSFVAPLRSAGLPLACVTDLNRRPAASSSATVSPDYLVLTAGTTRDLQSSGNCLHSLQSLLRSFSSHPCEVIASGLEHWDEVARCRQLGCSLGQGPLFADPPLISALAGTHEA